MSTLLTVALPIVKPFDCVFSPVEFIHTGAQLVHIHVSMCMRSWDAS